MTHEQFDEITQWQKATFPKATPISKLIHLAGEEPEGEIKELMFAINDESHVIDNAKRRAVLMEFADCFFLLFGAAAAYGLNYDGIVSAIQAKYEINKKRSWGKPDVNGVVNHIKP